MQDEINELAETKMRHGQSPLAVLCHSLTSFYFGVGILFSLLTIVN